MEMTVQYTSDLARWAEEHKDEIVPFLPVEEPGWIDQCKYYRRLQIKQSRIVREKT